MHLEITIRKNSLVMCMMFLSSPFILTWRMNIKMPPTTNGPAKRAKVAANKKSGMRIKLAARVGTPERRRACEIEQSAKQ